MAIKRNRSVKIKRRKRKVGGTSHAMSSLFAAQPLHTANIAGISISVLPGDRPQLRTSKPCSTYLRDIIMSYLYSGITEMPLQEYLDISIVDYKKLLEEE